MIDPDQSGELEMNEWIDFMIASDDDLELAMGEATTKEHKNNAAKGTGLHTLLGEGAGLFLGGTAGKLVDVVVDQVEHVSHATVGVVGKSMDTVGLSAVRKEILHDEEAEEEKKRRRAEAAKAEGGGAAAIGVAKRRAKAAKAKGKNRVSNPMNEGLVVVDSDDEDDGGGED